ncbi:MAG: Hpt domain-containing protein [Opitutaceae bacterium]|nr:Hpt domain-containing protein [Opitutaceae bacterium]
MPATQSLPVIDPGAIAELRALNPGDNDEFLRDVIGIFLADTPIRLAELDDSLAAGDTPKFTRAAHSIKGSSANVGAAALRTAAGNLEHRARTDGLGDVRALVGEVKAEFARTQVEFAALIAR